MAGWHHRLDGREFEWTLGVGDGQGGLACCDSGGRKESDTTEWLNWTENSEKKMTLFSAAEEKTPLNRYHIGTLSYKTHNYYPKSVFIFFLLNLVVELIYFSNQVGQWTTKLDYNSWENVGVDNKIQNSFANLDSHYLMAFLLSGSWCYPVLGVSQDST